MRTLSLDPKVELPGGTTRVRAVPKLARGRYVNLAFLWGRRSRFIRVIGTFLPQWVTASVGLFVGLCFSGAVAFSRDGSV